MRLNLKQSGSFIGMAGMAAMGFLYFASGLVAPAWAVVVLCVVWLAMLVLGFRWFMPHPYRVLALPVVAFVIWVAALNAGDYFLGWTA